MKPREILLCLLVACLGVGIPLGLGWGLTAWKKGHPPAPKAPSILRYTNTLNSGSIFITNLAGSAWLSSTNTLSFNWPKDQRYEFRALTTNSVLCLRTELKPIVTETNGEYVITFKEP